MTPYEYLMKTGYYVANVMEVFSTSQISKIRRCVKEDIEYNFKQRKPEHNNWQYFITCNWPDKDPNKNGSVRYSQIQNKLKQIEDEGAEINQSWFHKNYFELAEVPIPPDLVYPRLDNYIAKIYNTNEKLVTGFPSVTYYTKNDFIAVHQDGRNKNRICGLLIYLESPESYKKEYGGRLLLQSADQEVAVGEKDYDLLPVAIDPVSPNMVILDFTKHNIFHAVEKCYENFYRTALLTFFTLDQQSGL